MKQTHKVKVDLACSILGYTRQGYYHKGLRKTMIDKSILDRLMGQADKVRNGCPTRGCRAMYEYFGETLPIGRDKSVALLMALGYRVRYAKRYGRATQAGTREFPNLLVNKQVTGINQVWQADMAHYLYGDRKYYAIYITDVYSQQIVGYGAFNSNDASCYAKVLQGAIHRQVALKNGLKGLIHHSDGGKQYESKLYKQLCKDHQIKQSMCMYSYENPYAEKTNDLIHNGYLNVWRPKTLSELIKCQHKAVQNHNQTARKKVLGMLSPNTFKKLLINNNLCQGKYILELKPSNPEQPKKREINQPIFNRH